MSKVKISYGGEEVVVKPLKKQIKENQIYNPTLKKAKEILAVLVSAQGS